MKDLIERNAERLAEAWRKYKACFGEDPHGTVKQCAALLELAKSGMRTEQDAEIAALKERLERAEAGAAIYRRHLERFAAMARPDDKSGEIVLQRGISSEATYLFSNYFSEAKEALEKCSAGKKPSTNQQEPTR